MTPWIVRPRSGPGHAIRLVCLSYAGGGASLFRAWADDLPAEIELCAVQLPGREARLFEPAHVEMGPLVAELTAQVAPFLDRPFALFGHSMGALVSFELARSLRRKHRLSPLHLIVSGHAAPQLRTRASVDHRLPTDQLVAALRRLDGTPAEVLNNAELMDLMLPAIRADFAVCGTYAYARERLLNCPITAFAGLEDPLVSLEDVYAWRHQTTGPFALRTFAGGHFFIRDRPTLVVRAVQHALREPTELAVAA
jgi:medium-chain acyl-[acyl-carrier-protein] hydrolase